ncbi:MAG: hypothetical protein PSV36_04710 [Algoriphagus sp.]|nr:hypothetical protein [Algoriphagus sp.]
MKTLKSLFFVMYLSLLAVGCTQENETPDIAELTAADQTAIDLAQTAGQLASGTSFVITGSTSETGNINSRIIDATSTTEAAHGPGKGMGKGMGKGGHKGIMDGLNLLAPNDEILAIIDAESAGDFRGFRVYKMGGATITHYDADGKLVNLPMPATMDGPHGVSHSGKQFPGLDSLLSLVVKSVVDFGDGVTIVRNEEEITRSGKIIIERESSEDVRTETVTFENYNVNGIQIKGVKTRVSSFDDETGKGSSVTSVAGGQFIFPDGVTAAWVSDKSRESDIERSADTRKPISGSIITEVNTSITATDGTVIYSYKTLTPLEEDLSCTGKRRGPVFGVLETVYRENLIKVDFGDGSCTNQTITITVNGETTTKTIKK